MNPYTLARKELSLTQSELATLANVSTQVVTNLERGLFYKPPSNVVHAIHQAYKDRDPYQSWNVQRAAQTYTLWVTEERKSHSDKFPALAHDCLTDESNTLINLWDWVDFRHLVSPSFRGFCRALVFQPSMLAEWEDRGLNKDAVRRALREVGYTEDSADIILSMRKSSVEV